MAEMEAKLRVIIDDRIEKLDLPSGIPPTVEELHNIVKDTFGISTEFSLQYFDVEFEDYFTLHNNDLIKHKGTIKDTIILSGRSTTERCQSWPKQFPIPQFAYETEMYLERGNEDYKKNGTLLTTSKIKPDILEKLAETVYTYTAYPSGSQISDVAEALVNKYPCLKEPGSFAGYYGWQQSLKYKMSNYRTKLRGYGVPEVLCNALKRKNPADKKSAKNIQDEFHRITMVHLESKFMSKLDEYTPRLLNLFHSKGGTMGLRLQAILLKTPSNPDINMTRDVIIRCLMMYLGESTDQLLKEYDDADEDSVSQDLAVQSLKIYNIKAKTSEDPDIGIVVDGVKILTALGNFPRACSLLVGLAYAVNLAYPKKLRYTR
ncbi:uncharacterized protein LOC129356856 [Poeciliopsis prolifica]|uniref:uncharacterized protein LOC129356856 n=1 Tax=Poeciliopsis prolifica TaxID=188132 RepID=UPI0024143473|nr:uncharacterized protein LOC129356856 [Poeciliopsis prolifica]